MRAVALGAGWVAWICLAAPLAAQPRLVADLNRGPNLDAYGISLLESSGDPSVYYFAAADPAHGMEMWRTDGTAQGTRRVSDVCPGPCGSSPGAPQLLGGRILFAAEDGDSGSELWVSNGTPGSERLFRDFCPGPCSGSPADFHGFAGRLLFTVVGPDYNRHLWVTDGTAAGTVELADFKESSSYIVPWSFQQVGGTLFFNVSRGELWRTDGTPAGTRPLRSDFGVELGNTTAVQPLEGAGYFWTRRGLWRTDGTVTGTRKVKSMASLGIPIIDSIWFLVELTAWNGKLYSVFPGDQGLLVISDGTAGGTVRGEPLVRAGQPEPLASGVVIPSWAEDGKAVLLRVGGTGSLERIFERENSRLESGLMVKGDYAYFVVRDWTDEEYHLWRTDGTAEGTREVEGGTGFPRSWVWRPDGTLLTSDGQSLWRRNGDGSKAVRLRDFGEVPAGSGPLAQAVLGNRLVFSARTSAKAAPLFVSDGTAAGTRLVRRDSAWGSKMTRAGDRLFFSSLVYFTTEPGFVEVRPNGIWATDGTPSGTLQMSQPEQANGLLMPFGREVLYGGDASFPSYHPDLELWRTTRQVRGAELVRHIDRHQYEGLHHFCYHEPSDPGPGVVIGNRLVFAANDGNNGRELWTSDGTAPGTRLLKDVNPVREPWWPDGECDFRRSYGESSSPDTFLRFRQGALFVADDGQTGRELWWTDGRPAGTRRVADIVPGPDGSGPRELTLLGDVVYFLVTRPEPEGGDALWRTDGTAAGTFQVHDLKVDGVRSWARSLTAAGDKLFFSVYNEATGNELWASQGSGASTGLVADLWPGPTGSHPQALTAAGGVLVFAAADGAGGLEPWRSDGTAQGTRRLADIAPGPDASSPGPFSVVGETILTGANDGLHGRELWAIPLEDAVRP